MYRQFAQSHPTLQVLKALLARILLVILVEVVLLRYSYRPYPVLYPYQLRYLYRLL
tara:strand:- start:288 stop:455 length:168 start_codon:yes stop_codon:yes gene_type:complete